MYLYGRKKVDTEKFAWVPLKTLMGHQKDDSGVYAEILKYYEPLSDDDVKQYDLEYLGTDGECTECKVEV